MARPAQRRTCLRARGEGGARSATGGKHERGEQKGNLKVQIAFSVGVLGESRGLFRQPQLLRNYSLHAIEVRRRGEGG